ncbi:isopenicillin N synthase family dioxygenase [Actinophytocola oryzae]|uniref:Isopenicillin N synthase-like dioxygenase n=1 Tax=Actinophytocola oryzae TaxID=502181 RepID=A0A4R7VWR6_9PSEU|nr:2-oxoglutarate and iron-dependent oxygenase domain-containing protein [Actinophytocola oryzae]TDV53667.1 isopenicillin N synthase-like dioxygenase [Actinophytocola oryzae]
MTVPLVDLTPWFDGSDAGRAAVASRVDDALRESGFLLVTGHGVPEGLPEAVRTHARRFFGLAGERKARYAVPVGGRGWLPPGAETNAHSEGTETPPDLKESYSVGADQPTGDPEIDGFWFQPNVWPDDDVPELRAAAIEYMTRMRALSDELLRVCAVALGLAVEHFTDHTGAPTYTFNINWYPPRTHVGTPGENQFRIGPHTDFGTVTLLDREPGAGGLQVFTKDGEWVDAPYEPSALTVNIGDLMARWTGDRWRSCRHRVLPPPASAPDEELMSLVWFYETDPHARISSLAPPIGRRDHPPVTAHEYLLEKIRSIGVGQPD